LKLLVAGVLVIAGCPERGAAPHAAPPWVYEPDLAPWPPAPVTGEIGRGPRAAMPVPAGLAAGHRVWADEPFDVETIAGVPGEAIAIASGYHGDQWGVERVDVDAGLVRWRDLAHCGAPVVHVTGDVVVCSDAVHAVALALDSGRERWRSNAAVTGANGALVVGLDGGAVVVDDARDGHELARATVPDLGEDLPRAVCRDGGGFDVYTWGAASPVRRIAIAPGAPAKVAWTVVVGEPLGFDAGEEACDALVVITTPGAQTDESLIALDRISGAVKGGPTPAYGHWPARDGTGAIELAIDRGIERRTRALADPQMISDAKVGAFVASRGERRLVRARGGGLVLIDHDTATPIAAPLGVGRAVLGDHFIVSGPWRGIRTDRDTLRRYGIPRITHEEQTSTAPIPVDDPTRYDHPDLPPETKIDEAAAIAWTNVGTYHVATATLDPSDASRLYALPMEQRPTQTLGAGVAALDLRARRWLWHRPDACPPGTPIAIAIAPNGDAVACAARASAGNSGVRATRRADGAPLWDWRGPVDAIAGGGDTIAIVSASRVILLDGATGRERERFGADDGWMPRLALTDHVLIDAERGAVVGRDLATLLPRWAVRVRGAVTSIALAGDRVAIMLGDGELYLIDPATGAARAAGGWSEGWRAPGGGDLVVVATKDAALREWRVAGFGTDGVARFRTALTVEPDWQLGARGRSRGADLPVAYGPVLRHVALVEPVKGALRGLFTLPDRSVPGLVFSTVVDGKPVSGAVLSHPLAVVTF